MVIKTPTREVNDADANRLSGSDMAPPSSNVSGWLSPPPGQVFRDHPAGGEAVSRESHDIGEMPPGKEPCEPVGGKPLYGTSAVASRGDGPNRDEPVSPGEGGEGAAVHGRLRRRRKKKRGRPKKPVVTGSLIGDGSTMTKRRGEKMGRLGQHDAGTEKKTGTGHRLAPGW